MMKREKIEIKMTSCPECDANMTIPNDAVEGEIVTCPDCGASYELVKASDAVSYTHLTLPTKA